MALTMSNNGGGGGVLYITRSVNPLRRHVIVFPTSTSPTQDRAPPRLVVSAARKLSSSRTGRFDSKNRRSSGSTTTEEEQEKKSGRNQRRVEIEDDESVGNISGIENVGVSVDDGLVLPDLPGEKPDFWEGSQWDGLGFFVQYMWAFGIGFALIACGIAVVTYNEGATDFKETPAYKESVQSRELLEGPEASDSDVFESNPTEVAPSLD